MVDCDLFTEFNKFLIIEENRLLLDYKNCDYALQLAFPNQPCKKISKVTSNNFIKKLPIKAVYGVIQMEVNNYLVVITKAAVIGQIYHRKIFQVQKAEFICLARKQSSQDKTYLQGLEDIFSSKFFYFSDDYDLTNSLQRFISANCSMKNKRLNYMYNSDWIDDFLKIKAYEWVTGFISGFVAINFTHVNVNNACEIALVSRRDKRRQGMRWITRGADLDGNTANTAQTQVIFLNQTGGKQNIFSHVQLRGSMPFFWNQDPDLKWSPKVSIHSNDKLNCQMTKKNYEDIKTGYENCALINLIDKKGSQKKLGDYFQKMHDSVADPSMRLVWFDFHHECRKMKYQNLAHLLDMVSKQIQNYGYFHIEFNKNSNQRASKKAAQKGIFRTNCMDCLDRTNVVQSVFARQLLLSWLIKLGIITKSRTMTAFEKLPQHLQQIFRAQWTKNADVISILYSGTPAMKTDFTATGKRTFKGSLKDGYNGVKRFFLGNFYDSKQQDFIDFSLNKIKPKKNENQRIRHSSFNMLFLLAVVIIAIPFVVSYQVDAFREGNQQNHSNFSIKAAISLLAIAIVAKTFQIMNPVIVRKPITSKKK